MLLELATTGLAATIFGVAKLKQDGSSGDDAKKILQIADNVGLKKNGKSIRLYRRNPANRKKGRHYSEYVFKIPLGLSLDDFKSHLDKFEDGLNNKRTLYIVSLKDLKNIRWAELKKFKTIEKKFNAIKRQIGDKYKIKKTIDLSYDGMLRFKVYEQDIPSYIDFNEELWNECKGFNMPLGMDREGVLFLDLGDGHIIVAGATTFGKSQFLKLLISTLLHNKPDDTELSLIDLKGGLEMMYFEDCKQTINFADDLGGAVRVLRMARDAIKERQEILRLNKWNNVRKAGITKRHFIIVDEASQLAPSQVSKNEKDLAAECQSLMSFITRIGHSMGYTLVYATQYPVGDVMPNQIKANSSTTICFRLETDTQSDTVLDKKGAELIQYRGRCIFRKPSGMRPVQTFLIDDSTIDKVVTPNINIRPREDDPQHEQIISETRTEDRRNIAVFEDTDLS